MYVLHLLPCPLFPTLSYSLPVSPMFQLSGCLLSYQQTKPFPTLRFFTNSYGCLKVLFSLVFTWLKSSYSSLFSLNVTFLGRPSVNNVSHWVPSLPKPEASFTLFYFLSLQPVYIIVYIAPFHHKLCFYTGIQIYISKNLLICCYALIP